MTLLLVSLAANAQNSPLAGGEVPALNAQNFRPTIDGTYTLWADDARRLNGTLFRALVHYVDDPFIYQPGEGETLGLVTSATQLDLLLGWGIGRFRLGADIPVYLYSTGEEASGTGLGDVGVEAKVTALDGEDAPVDLALSARVSVPSTTLGLPLGNPSPQWEVAVAVSQEQKHLFERLNVGYRGGPKTALENVDLDDSLAARAALGWAFNDATGVALETAAQLGLADQSVANAPWEWLVSGYGHASREWVVRAGAGAGITAGIGSPDFRAILGIGYEPPATPELDTDGDGIVDRLDPCPAVAEDLDGMADSDGCPETPRLTVVVIGPDSRPMPNATVTVNGGATPLTGPAGSSWDVPPGKFTISALADGMGPGEESVEIVATDEGKTVTLRLAPKPVGTLVVLAVDEAGQPIPAFDVAVAGAKVGTAPKFEGPQTPGTYDVVVTSPGYKPAKDVGNVKVGEVTTVKVVMVKAMAELVGDRIDIRDSVYFDTAKATIQSRSFALLDEVVSILKDHPELKKLRVEGHTDSRGSATYNKDLSQSRATAVRTYLIDHGILAERLEAVGYGEEKPVDPREVAEAWEKNRRVDFFVVERSD